MTRASRTAFLAMALLGLAGSLSFAAAQTTGAVPPASIVPPRGAAPKPGTTPNTSAQSTTPAPAAKPTANNTVKPPSMPAPGETQAFDAEQRTLVERVSNYLSGIHALTGKFVQVGPDGARTTGEFYLQKPGKVRFEYDAPSPIAVIADGQSVVVRDQKLATQDLYPLSQTPLRYLLQDRIDLLRDTNVVGVSADDVFITILVEERSLVVGTNRLMMMFGAKDLQLKQWTITDPQGFDTTVAVYNLDTAKKPDPNLFVITYERQDHTLQ